MKNAILILFLFVFLGKSFYAIQEDCINLQPVDSLGIDSSKNTNIHPVKIYYELLGSSIWMSLNYQQTIFSKNRYSLDFLIGINNWEFSEFDVINSHYFLLNRFSNKSKVFFIEFGPGFKLGGSLGERKLGCDISWNTSIMKVFQNNLFFKFNTTFSSSYLYKLHYDPNSEATFFYGYPAFPIGLSLGYKFGNSKISSYKKNYIKAELPNNIIAINSILGLSYERLIFRKNNNALYLSFNPNIYVLKKYDVSKKTGFILLHRNLINYVQQINSTISTELGVGHTYFKEKFSIYDEMFTISTSQINLNMGIRIIPLNHFIIKVNYSPAMWASNYNLTYSYNYIYNQLDQHHSYQIANKFFITFGFAW